MRSTYKLSRFCSGRSARALAVTSAMLHRAYVSLNATYSGARTEITALDIISAEITPYIPWLIAVSKRIGPHLDLEIAHLVGRIRSGVRVAVVKPYTLTFTTFSVTDSERKMLLYSQFSASFQKSGSLVGRLRSGLTLWVG